MVDSQSAASPNNRAECRADQGPPVHDPHHRTRPTWLRRREVAGTTELTHEALSHIRLFAKLDRRYEMITLVQTGDWRPSYDELAALVVQQAQVIAELQQRVAALEAENAELKRRLGMDSTNSSKPPSSDSPFTKPAPKSLRRKSGRKPGGQPGHPGSTLALVDNPH